MKTKLILSLFSTLFVLHASANVNCYQRSTESRLIPDGFKLHYVLCDDGMVFNPKLERKRVIGDGFSDPYREESHYKCEADNDRAGVVITCDYYICGENQSFGKYYGCKNAPQRPFVIAF